MGFFEKFQTTLEKIMGPFASIVSTNKFIRALTAGFMASMPITLGTAVIAVLGNLPITPWQNFLVSTGLYQTAQDFISLTLSLLAIYVIEAFVSGQPLPYLTFSIVGLAIHIGGNGNTLGLCIATFFAKSEKYKSMRKLVVPANLFNINEPIIFGFPTMLNPLYFIPMVFTSLVSGAVAMVLLIYIF